MKGGYQVFDLKDKNFTSGSSTVVGGSRAIINGSNRKRTLVENLQVGGTKFDAFDASFSASSTTAPATAKAFVGSNTITMSVAANDAVTVTVS